MYSAGPCLHSGNLFATRDPGIARDHVANALWPHVMRLKPGVRSIEFQRHWETLGSITLNSQRYGREVWINAKSDDDSYLVLFTLSGANRIEIPGGTFDATAGTICVLNPTLRCRIHSSADFDHTVLRISMESVRQSLIQDFGLFTTRRIQFHPLVIDTATGTPGLESLVRFICTNLNTPAALRHPETVRHLERSLVNTLLLEVPHNCSDLMRPSTGRIAPYHLQVARDYLHARAREPIPLAELAALARVSERALQLGFRRHFGMSPMQYLRECRLNLARQLLESDPDSIASVTGLAMECGFADASRFARYYKERFGTGPSTVLRRARRPRSTAPASP